MFVLIVNDFFSIKTILFNFHPFFLWLNKTLADSFLYFTAFHHEELFVIKVIFFSLV